MSVIEETSIKGGRHIIVVVPIRLQIVSRGQFCFLLKVWSVKIRGPFFESDHLAVSPSVLWTLRF